MSWQAKVDYDPVMDTDMVTLWRRAGFDVELVARCDTLSPEVRRVSGGVTPEFGPLRLPAGAALAIAAAVRPGPTQETLDVLGEALDIERRRVDDVLRALSSRSHVPDEGQVAVEQCFECETLGRNCLAHRSESALFDEGQVTP